MTLEVLFAQQEQAATFLRMVLLGAAFALCFTISGVWRRKRALSDAADVMAAMLLMGAALLVLLHSGEGMRLYALLGLLLGAALYEAGLRRILIWMGKQLKKIFSSGRKVSKDSE